MQNSNHSRKSISRREFIGKAGTTAAGLALAGSAWADGGKSAPVRIGNGYHTYELVENWGVLPETMHYGMGCGVVVDSKDRVYVHSRSQQAVCVFDRNGKLLHTWGAEFAGNGHGLYWSREGRDEFLFFTTNTPGDSVIKTDLNGKKVLEIGNVTEESSTAIPFKFDNPTDVAIAHNGDIYVCEGYGGQHIHRFSKLGKYIQTMGGKGDGPEQFNICHGIWVDTRKKEPEIYIADRANARLQVFTPELQFKRSLRGSVRMPCCFYTHQNHLYVPDLDHRVTILDENDQEAAQLGDGRGKDRNDPATFEAPHALTVDSHGDMYVIEWRPDARLRKFRHVPQA